MRTPERSEINRGELSKTLGYLRESMELGLVKNFTIDGPVKDEPTLFRDFIFISDFALRRSGETEMKVVTTSDSSVIEIYDKILKLTFPQRLRDLKISTIPTLKKVNRTRTSLLKMPYIIIALGKIRSTEEKIISMFCVTGMSPEEAFTEVQERVRSRKITFN